MNVVAIKEVVSVLGGTKKLGKSIKSDRDLEKIVTEGLPAELVEIFVDRIYPNSPNYYYEVVPRSTLNRKLKDGSPLPLQYSERVERLARIYAFALEVWDSEEDAREFMTKKHPMLDDRTPFEASMTDLGARQVEQVLGRLMFGSAA
ncbi:MAG: antitoxin Xre/MbcA/ParS toxin-binding domain-containing protein [Cyanobacteria bacterium J06621_12]